MHKVGTDCVENQSLPVPEWWEFGLGGENSSTYRYLTGVLEDVLA